VSVPPLDQSLPWHRRLETRVVCAIGALVALSITAVLVATTRTITARSFDRAATDLEAGRLAFDRIAGDRADFAAAQAALVTALPVFRAHLTDSRLAGDVATLEVMGDEYRRQLKASFCIVADRSGRWTVQPGWPAGVEPSAAVRASVSAAAGGRSHREIADVGDQLFLIVSEPARFAEETLGSLTVGLALDDTVAQQLSGMTRSDVNIIARRRLAASSLTGSNRAALAALAAGSRLSELGMRRAVRQIGTERFVIGVFPLAIDAAPETSARLILLQNWSPTQQFIDEIQGRLLSAGALILAFATCGGLIFSRYVSRPLERLTTAAGDIASGNWARRVDAGGGGEAGMLGRAFNDMTMSLRHWYEEAKRRDDELRQAQKMEAIGRLAGGVAHDFNNLLTAIRGYSELVQHTLDREDARRADLDEIVKASDRGAGLTRQLLAFSRHEVVRPRVLALDRIVIGTQQMLRRLIGEDVELKSTIAEGIWPVRADAGQIEQVLLNLAVNARDAMATGGVLTIALANVTVDDTPFVRLSMTDTGTGMDDKTVARIFEPFFTTKAEGHGTGLGLSTVYGIVRQAGGTIDVVTEPGQGSTFHVCFPRCDEPVEAERPETRLAEHAPVKAVETVLLVEDDRGVNTLIAHALRQVGYTVLAAPEGERALEIVRTHDGPIHLLLTDVVMPGMNGRELSEHVASARPDTRVLFMSGYPDDAIVRQGIKAASVHFIQKPFSMQELVARIRQALNPASTALDQRAV